MVIITNANGDVVKNIPENIYQGSNNANSIVVLAPFASSSQLTIAYRLPDGVLTEPALMTPYEDVPSEYDLSGWSINLDEAITEKYGNVDFQVRATTNSGTVVASFGFNFTVLRGVAPILPPTPSQSIYEQILTALASIEADIVNGWLESKGLLPYDETFTYSLNTILYSNNTFYKSKIPDNVGNHLSDTDSWEEIPFATEQEVADLIQAHNISETAHNDIRLILAGLIDGTYPIDSCANVSETINNINITDIFESNGITAKSATNAKNDALGNDIAGTYSKILDIINNVNSTDIDKPLSANQGKVLQEQITALSGSLVPQGNWDASTNTPNISETTTTGHYWIVSVAGTTDFGGITDWQVNDWIVKTSTSWAKIDNSDNTKMEKITSNYIYSNTETMIADELNIQEGQIVKGGEIYYVYLGTTNSSISDFGMIGGGDNWINYASESFKSGTGTELDPYIIASPEQLAYLSKLVISGLNQSGVYFKLNNNIDLSKKQWTPIGRRFTIAFSGTFLGNNKIINGLTIISTSSGVGLFGDNAGTIKDLELRNTFICGYQFVGGIAGFNSGVISNCINNGVVMALNSGGGIAGHTTLNTIEYCINYSTLIGNNTGNEFLGGITGNAHNPIYVKHCVNFGDILGTGSYVGGIVGSLSDGHIYYSYNFGNIFGNDRVGGIVGVIGGINPSSSIFECYNIGRVKGLTNVGGVYGSINAGNSYSSYYLENIIEGENDSTGLNKTLTEIRNLVADGILDNTYWEDDVNITGMLTPALKSINYNLQNNSKYITGRAIQENINNIEFDLAFKESKILKFADTSVLTTAFVADETYTAYGYRASITLSGVLATDIPQVVLGVDEATSGTFAPISSAYSGGIYIYASEVPSSTITIPTITIIRGV